jgi:hypothetical protein
MCIRGINARGVNAPATGFSSPSAACAISMHARRSQIQNQPKKFPEKIRLQTSDPNQRPNKVTNNTIKEIV